MLKLTIKLLSHLLLISLFLFEFSCSTSTAPLISKKSSVDTQYLYKRQLEKFGKDTDSFLILFYRKVVSKTLFSRCPMYPSCSRFSQLAQKKEGPLKASIRTTARLLREVDSNEIGLPLINRDNHVYFWDLP